MKYALTIAIALILFSCKCADPIVKTDIQVRTDTVYVKELVRVSPALDQDWEKENPCDSLTGKLKDFERIIENGSSKVVVKSVGGILKTEVRIAGSTDRMIAEHRKSMESSKITIEVPVEVNKPWKSKWFWYSIIANVLFILYLIKRFTNWLGFLPI